MARVDTSKESDETSTLRTVADAMAEELKRAGIDRVFGLPGGEVLVLIDALRRQGVEFVLCRHEANAGLMAAVYGKLKGVPGVVIATLGPGASNLLLSVTNSLLDREPLLAISAQVPNTWSASRTHQRLPLLEVFRPITKLAQAINAFNCRGAIRDALAASIAEPAGPTFLTVSTDVARAVSVAPESPEITLTADSASWPLGNPEAAAAEIRDRLESAERPVLAVGMGAHVEHAALIRRWVEEWRLPVTVTPKMKGIVDETHPLFAGVITGMALDRVIVEGLAHADLIVGLGLDPAEIDGDWHERFPIIWVLDSPCATGLVPASGLVACDHYRLLEAVLAKPAPRVWADPLTEARAERRRVLDGPAGASGFLSPVGAVRALAEALPEQTIVTTDVGSHKYLFGQFWPSRMPGTFFVSNGLSGMGYGLPAAIAAKLARPDQPVLAVLGDGGFSMNSQELETARRSGAKILVAVLVDSSYSLIRMGQRKQGLERYGVDFEPIDIVLTAQACGVRGCRASSEAELTDWAREAFTKGEITVVEIPIRADDYAAMV
jgi:acetolactate synthase I/II/III large subunit